MKMNHAAMWNAHGGVPVVAVGQGCARVRLRRGGQGFEVKRNEEM